MPLPSASALLAAIEAGILVRAFVVAAVLLIPYGLHQRRRIQARPATPAAPETPPESLPGGGDRSHRARLEDVIAGFTDVAAQARARGAVTVTVPAEVTVDGRDAPAAVVDAMVRDALRRSGLVATAELDLPTGRSIECHPAPPAPR